MELVSKIFRRRTTLIVVVFIICIIWLWATNSDHQFIANSSSLSSHHEAPKTSRLHYLIPSSIVNDAVCAGIVSALVNQYPIPTLIGYKGKNEFDSADHLAKLRVMNRYFDDLDAQDDDLVIIVDSFDVLAQLPAEVMIERYFDMSKKSEQRLADQRGLTVDQLHELGIRQTILYGAGKMCFVASPNEPMCPLMPPSNSPRYKFGVRTGNDDTRFLDSRYLNSGTIMGPVGDIRKFVRAVLDLVKADDEKVDPNDEDRVRIHHMDQWFTAQLYVRQEYHRALDMNGGEYPADLSNLTSLPRPRDGPEDNTEFHVFVDFDSSFTQTQCRNELEIQFLKYKNHDLTAAIDRDFLQQDSAFRPYNIQMPSNVYQAFGRAWDRLSAVPELQIALPQRQWIQRTYLATNIASESIYAFYHNTCDKRFYLERYKHFWFYPYITTLLEQARAHIQQGKPIHPGVIDGRSWVAAKAYPADGSSGVEKDTLGGVYTDLKEEPFIDLSELCKENITTILNSN
ncbi:unnamed protein product [Fusarium graminearum]|nr:hypothetical protein HG531_005677 [Fusarium graminearum]PCD20815.1 hypothetical protein FGRA07_04967 [Fusarium graminearum]CAG1973152.1 unnamed protein product [Fusarium graminearum]CAG1986085.1 unnamed protein product [Fusarium graminearum]